MRVGEPFALPPIEPRWDAERAQVCSQAIVRRRRRRRALRGAIVAILVVASLGVAHSPRAEVALRQVAALFASDRARTHEDDRAPAGSGVSLTFHDGSTATAEVGALLRTRSDGGSATEIDLVAGAARFDVVHDPGRVFRVRAGGVTVDVLGTAFRVAREPDGTATVSVERGRVRAHGADAWEIGAGESRRVRPAADDATVPLAAPARDFESPAPADVATLLARADDARAARRIDDAIAALDEIVRLHASDPRAAVAAFTLGRLLSDEGRAADAAQAFAVARRLSPTRALADDARSRELRARASGGSASGAQR
jgi:transmembrane sensor